MATILLVEDDPALSKGYRLTLEWVGHDVVHASNGLEALERLKTVKPSIILLDMLMPQMGGLEFLKLFNATEHPDIKVVMLSNFDDAEKTQEALDLGAVKYMLKASTDPQAIIDMVQGLLVAGTKR